MGRPDSLQLASACVAALALAACVHGGRPNEMLPKPAGGGAESALGFASSHGEQRMLNETAHELLGRLGLLPKAALESIKRGEEYRKLLVMLDEQAGVVEKSGVRQTLFDAHQKQLAEVRNILTKTNTSASHQGQKEEAKIVYEQNQNANTLDEQSVGANGKRERLTSSTHDANEDAHVLHTENKHTVRSQSMLVQRKRYDGSQEFTLSCGDEDYTIYCPPRGVTAVEKATLTLEKIKILEVSGKGSLSTIRENCKGSSCTLPEGSCTRLVYKCQ